jgi:hypothetical protein
LSTGTLYCPNCGSPVQQQAQFCANCGTKITAPTAPASQVSPGYYPPVPAQPPSVSTGPYKAVIAILLIVIVLLGIGLYETSVGHFPFGTYRYQLANPPDTQSIQPPPSSTPPPGQIIWNSCGATNCTMQTNGWREGTVPDTYDYFVTYTSNVPITVYFLTLGQFVQYAVCNGDLTCVSGSYAYLPAATSQNDAVFKLAEGCADYIAIYVSSANGFMTPRIQVAENAYSSPTGYCAQAQV